MARTREYDPHSALQGAIRVFWERGFYETSIDEVVERSGVAKYGLYSTFGSKRDLFVAALQQFANDRAGDIQSRIRSQDATLDSIREFFDEICKAATSPDPRLGCMICNAGIEMAPHDKEIAAMVRSFFRDLGRAFTDILDQAVARNELAASADTVVLGRYLATQFRTIAVMARSGESCDEISGYLDVALKALRSH